MKRTIIFLIFLIIFLSGCREKVVGKADFLRYDLLISQTTHEQNSTKEITEIATEDTILDETWETTPTNTPSATQVVTEIPSATITPLIENQIAATNILELTFPTPIAEAVSLWRPPLYDTPWALSKYDHFYFSRPIAADEVNWPLADYRYGGIFFGADIVHTGIDIPAKRGTTVIAAGKGKVIWAGYGLFYGSGAENDPYGLAVSIEHDFGYKGQKLYTIYAHLDQIDVQAGQAVDTGTPLGLVGMTGNTTGPHLHFEVRIEDDSFYKTRNPELWIAPPQGWGVLAGDFRANNGKTLDHQIINIRSLSTGQKWQVYTYGPVTVHKDDYYQENMVISDLDAGTYEVTVDYIDESYTGKIEIYAGALSYIRFLGESGFDYSGPPTDIIQTWPDQE